tara:strand:- start:206 stop:334 length:129 start_codon:yes stop_codon:yes gene_type:complete
MQDFLELRIYSKKGFSGHVANCRSATLGRCSKNAGFFGIADL